MGSAGETSSQRPFNYCTDSQGMLPYGYQTKSHLCSILRVHCPLLFIVRISPSCHVFTLDPPLLLSLAGRRLTRQYSRMTGYEQRYQRIPDYHDFLLPTKVADLLCLGSNPLHHISILGQVGVKRKWDQLQLAAAAPPRPSAS